MSATDQPERRWIDALRLAPPPRASSPRPSTPHLRAVDSRWRRRHREASSVFLSGLGSVALRIAGYAPGGPDEPSIDRVELERLTVPIHAKAARPGAVRHV